MRRKCAQIAKLRKNAENTQKYAGVRRKCAEGAQTYAKEIANMRKKYIKRKDCAKKRKNTPRRIA